MQINIGNNMISSVLMSTRKYFKDNNIARVICSPWKIFKSLFTPKLHENSCCYLLIIYMKENTESQDGRNFCSARYL